MSKELATRLSEHNTMSMGFELLEISGDTIKVRAYEELNGAPFSEQGTYWIKLGDEIKIEVRAQIKQIGRDEYLAERVVDNGR